MRINLNGVQIYTSKIVNCAGLHNFHSLLRQLRDSQSRACNTARYISSRIFPRALSNNDAWDIAALEGVQVLDFGLMDFLSSHHGAIASSNMRSPGQFEHPVIVRAKTGIVAAALAHGVVPAHNVSLDLKNTYSVFRDAWRARTEFGFLRMWSIHPAQIQPIVDAMKPDLREVADAAAILLAAQSTNWGPIQYQGELHDRATYRYFWELLQKAQVTGVTLPHEAAEAFFEKA